MPDKRPPIKLTNRDFETIKEDLVNYAKVYYPQTYRDFSDASFGAMMMDMVAYVGDILSFYVDYQTNETFIDSAIERQNVINLSKQLGYKTPGAKSSTGTCYFYATVPSGSGGGVNTDAMPILKKGATLRSNSGASFLLIEVFPNNSCCGLSLSFAAGSGLPTAEALHYAVQNDLGNFREGQIEH